MASSTSKIKFPFQIPSGGTTSQEERSEDDHPSSDNISVEESVRTTGTTSSSSPRRKDRRTASSRNVKYGRLLFVLVLAVAAAILGFGSYRLMANAQRQMASDRFDSIAERALAVAQYVIEEKKKATDSLALMIANTHPNASSYPMVALSGYTEIASSLRIVTEGSLSYCPIVIPGGEEQTSFEEFAYELFAKEGFANHTGESDFGRGIYSYGDGQYGNETYEDGQIPYHHWMDVS